MLRTRRAWLPSNCFASRNEPKAFLYAFDLLELNGTDLRRETIEVSFPKIPSAGVRA